MLDREIQLWGCVYKKGGAGLTHPGTPQQSWVLQVENDSAS